MVVFPWVLLACAHPTLPTAGPNLLVITVDTLRADHVGAWGYGRPTTPVIDALAAGGSRFTNTFTVEGLTEPALVSLFTSLHPIEHGVRANAAPRVSSNKVPISLARVLCTADRDCTHLLTNAYNRRWDGFSTPSPKFPGDGEAADAAIRWLTEHKDSARPFFLWVHLWAPHEPYVGHPEGPSFVDPAYTGAQDGTMRAATSILVGEPPPSPADIQHLVDLYDGEVAYADAQIGRVLATLRTLGLDGRTLVVVSADHGEELYEHPPFLYHIASAWDGVLRIPLVLTQPGVVPAGRAVAQAVSICDVAPTILDLLGVPAPDGWSGRSLVPVLAGGGVPDLPVYSELRDLAVVVHDGPRVAIFNPTGGGIEMVPRRVAIEAGLTVSNDRLLYAPPTAALFDWQADRGEHHDLAADQPDELARLRGLVEAWQRDVGWPGVMPDLATVSPEVRAQLESLGYAVP